MKASCDAGGIGVDCGRFQKAGLDLHTISLPPLGRSNADPRVKAIAVVDPEFSRSFTQASLAGISIPVRLINLGKLETIWPGLNAEGATRAIPRADLGRDRVIRWRWIDVKRIKAGLGSS